MDAAQWPQGIAVVKPVDHDQAPRSVSTEKKPRPQKEQALNCPRCNSTNTKFCYYNNYSLTQPRYFCKTCRRYWTEGGSLRNVPVGGGSRKNKRSTSTSSSSAAAAAAPSKKPIPDLSTPSFPQTPSQNPKFHGAQDLNLAYPPSSDHYSSISNLVALQPKHNSSSPNTNSHHLPSMEFLKNGISSRGLNSFMPMPVLSDCGTIYSSGLPSLHDFKPTLNFSLDGFENGYGNLQGVQETNAKMFFPNLEELKPVSTADEFDHQQNRGQGEQSNNGYWSGMLGGGSW